MILCSVKEISSVEQSSATNFLEANDVQSQTDSVHYTLKADFQIRSSVDHVIITALILKFSISLPNFQVRNFTMSSIWIFNNECKLSVWLLILFKRFRKKQLSTLREIEWNTKKWENKIKNNNLKFKEN